jgi:hypothetical protein
MHHEGRRALTQNRAMPRPTGRGSAACGEASKFNRRCTQMNADGPEAGMVVHGRDRAPGPGEPRRCSGPCPIGVHRCASVVAISCLLPRVPDPAARTAGRRAHARTPCTCTDCRQPSHRRSRGAAGIAPGEAEPHAPVHVLADRPSGTASGAAVATEPHAPERSAAGIPAGATPHAQRSAPADHSAAAGAQRHAPGNTPCPAVAPPLVPPSPGQKRNRARQHPMSSGGPSRLCRRHPARSAAGRRNTPCPAESSGQ